jgi:REP-associated tyrosine transposase
VIRCSRKENLARLLLDVLYENRKLGRFQLHEFVVMPDHFHLILTPAPDKPLERALQYIKGGYSFRVKRELAYKGLPWEKSFTNHRIHDFDDYQQHRDYVHQNPVKAGLVKTPAEYPYSSAHPGFELDLRPPWLKPEI